MGKSVGPERHRSQAGDIINGGMYKRGNHASTSEHDEYEYPRHLSAALSVDILEEYLQAGAYTRSLHDST
jgi:hypothetical protein